MTKTGSKSAPKAASPDGSRGTAHNTVQAAREKIQPLVRQAEARATTFAGDVKGVVQRHPRLVAGLGALAGFAIAALVTRRLAPAQVARLTATASKLGQEGLKRIDFDKIELPKVDLSGIDAGRAMTRLRQAPERVRQLLPI